MERFLLLFTLVITLLAEFQLPNSNGLAYATGMPMVGERQRDAEGFL